MKKTITGAIIIAGVSTISMTYLFNNVFGTNNSLAFLSGLITASAFIVARRLELA